MKGILIAMPDNEMPGKGSMDFMPPKGLEMPEAEPGEDFEMEATFRMKPDGMMCLTSVGGMPMPGYGEEQMQEERQKPPSLEEEGKSLRNSAQMEDQNSMKKMGAIY